jgi:hypothetical protein
MDGGNQGAVFGLERGIAKTHQTWAEWGAAPSAVEVRRSPSRDRASKTGAKQAARSMLRRWRRRRDLPKAERGTRSAERGRGRGR